MLCKKFPVFSSKYKLNSSSFETHLDRLDDAKEPGTPSIYLKKEKFNKNYNYSRRPSKLAKQKWNFWVCNSDIQDSGSEIDEDERRLIYSNRVSFNDKSQTIIRLPQDDTKEEEDEKEREEKTLLRLGKEEIMEVFEISGTMLTYQSVRNSRLSNSQSLGGSRLLPKSYTLADYPRDLNKEAEKQLKKISLDMEANRKRKREKKRKSEKMRNFELDCFEDDEKGSVTEERPYGSLVHSVSSYSSAWKE